MYSSADGYSSYFGQTKTRNWDILKKNHSKKEPSLINFNLSRETIKISQNVKFQSQYKKLKRERKVKLYQKHTTVGFGRLSLLTASFNISICFKATNHLLNNWTRSIPLHETETSSNRFTASLEFWKFRGPYGRWKKFFMNHENLSRYRRHKNDNRSKTGKMQVKIQTTNIYAH